MKRRLRTADVLVCSPYIKKDLEACSGGVLLLKDNLLRGDLAYLIKNVKMFNFTFLHYEKNKDG